MTSVSTKNRTSSLLQVLVWPVQGLYTLWLRILSKVGKLMNSKQEQAENITNEECEKTLTQDVTSSRKEVEPEDTVDFAVNDPVLQALEGVSEAIYKVCFSKWHCPPEETKEQPLFKEIAAAIRGIFYNLKAKVRPLEEYEILIAVVNALITHLKYFREKKVTCRTPQEEADFLRNQTKCLLLYWLPDSLRDSCHILVFLNEIISINVLRPSINILAEPTFINETIVKTLSSEEVAEKKHGLVTSNVFNATCVFTEDHSDADVFTSDSNTCRKKKKKGVVNKLKGMVKPKKKGKKHGEHSEFRSFTGGSEEDTAMYSTDGCIDSDLCDESDEGDLLSSVIESVLQKWLQENWTAAITENPTEDRHTYKICVSEEDSLSTKLWLTERNVKDFRRIYNIICREFPDLNVFTTLEKSEEAEIDEDSQFFQAIGTNPDAFVDILVKLIKVHENSASVFFFSPFNYEEESELHGNAFSDDDLLPEDYSKTESDDSDELDETTDDPNNCYESDGFRMFQQKKKNKQPKDGSGSELEDTCDPKTRSLLCSSEGSPPLEKANTFRGLEKMATQSYTTELGITPTGEKGVNYRRLGAEKNTQRKKLEDALLEAVCHLGDELFLGGKSILSFLQRTGILKKKGKEILDRIPTFFTEDKIVWYLNKTSELLLADICPLPIPPEKLPSVAQELLKKKMQSLLANYIKFFWGRKVLKYTSSSHEAFQNVKANKETIFRILEDLTKIITNGSQ